MQQAGARQHTLSHPACFICITCQLCQPCNQLLHPVFPGNAILPSYTEQLGLPFPICYQSDTYSFTINTPAYFVYIIECIATIPSPGFSQNSSNSSF